MIVNEVTNIIGKELGTNEKLLWAGVPRKGLALRKSDAILIPFSLLWTAGVLYSEYQAFRESGELFNKLWGIPFILMGLYMLIGRFFVDMWQRDRTYYAVTNERVIILMHWFGKKHKSLPLKNLQDITLDERTDGSGTITFGQTPEPDKSKEIHRSFRLSAPSQSKNQSDSEQAWPAFEMIPQAKAVYNLIREAQ